MMLQYQLSIRQSPQLDLKSTSENHLLPSSFLESRAVDRFTTDLEIPSVRESIYICTCCKYALNCMQRYEKIDNHIQGKKEKFHCERK